MKKYIYFGILISLFGLAGCDLADKAEEKVTEEYERIVHQYEEYRGEGQENKPRPFTVVYQENENDKITLISSECVHNSAVNYVYYETQAIAHSRALDDMQNLISYPGKILKPFWDIRYIDPVSKYMNGGTYDHYPDHSKYTGLDTRSGVNNIGIGTEASKVEAGGSITQAECINGSLAGGVMVNLYNAPEQYINYGGPQSTFMYQLGSSSSSYPWKADGTGNLMIQSYFDEPLYFNFEENSGGGIYFGLFLKNRHNGKILNYVVGLYAAGDAWIQEKRGIQFDPTTNIVHVATVASDESWWSTKSPLSKSIQEVFSTDNKTTSDDQRWSDFYRVNISYQNLLVVLRSLAETPPAGAEGQDFGLKPEDWNVMSVMIQHEVEEKGGKATLSGSFRGFEAYTSQNPL